MLDVSAVLVDNKLILDIVFRLDLQEASAQMILLNI